MDTRFIEAAAWRLLVHLSGFALVRGLRATKFHPGATYRCSLPPLERRWRGPLGAPNLPCSCSLRHAGSCRSCFEAQFCREPGGKLGIAAIFLESSSRSAWRIWNLSCRSCKPSQLLAWRTGTFSFWPRSATWRSSRLTPRCVAPPRLP